MRKSSREARRSGGAQLSLTPPLTLPLRPEKTVGLEPLERGRFYNLLDLDSWQRGCIEEACRMVLAGRYGEASR
jgi:hypothetical protein